MVPIEVPTPSTSEGLIAANWPAPVNVEAWVSTRNGGASAPPYDSFNLATHVGDDAGTVANNRNKLAQLIQCRHSQWLDQTHSTIVAEPAADLSLQTGDALYTRQKNIALAVLTADCLPVVFCTESADEIAVAHAGWRGLSAGILEAVVSKFSTSTESIMAWLGPAIGPRQFQVGEDVVQAFVDQAENEKCFTPWQQGSDGKKRCYANLYELARLRLLAQGVSKIYGAEFCTVEDKANFYSYRRQAITGRMATIILIRG